MARRGPPRAAVAISMPPADSSISLPPDELLFGRSERAHALRSEFVRVAQSDLPLLIEGETGTGKQVAAAYVHAHSPRAQQALITVSCPANPSSLLESELFGYEAGAFASAPNLKPGRVEAANGGTLVLDEIGDMDVQVQAKLLRILQDGEFSRIGAQQNLPIDVRLICTTSRDLHPDVERGEFRRDLFYRINVLQLRLLPLRERDEDIPYLADYFVERYTKAYNVDAPALPPSLVRRLENYPWPGNIRELENTIKRYVVMGAAGVDMAASELTGVTPITPPVSLESLSLRAATQKALRTIERDLIEQALQRTDWNRTRAARVLKISYRSLLMKIKQLGIKVPATESRWRTSRHKRSA